MFLIDRHKCFKPGGNGKKPAKVAVAVNESADLDTLLRTGTSRRLYAGSTNPKAVATKRRTKKR